MRLPDLRLEMVEDLSPPGQTGFLQLVRRRYRVHYPDGTVSEPFPYDMVDRRAIDAVVIAAHFRSGDGVRHVYLRSAFRPPVVERELSRSPDPNETVLSSTWELPAGLIDVEEQKPGGAARAAQRELHEELGFDVWEQTTMKHTQPAYKLWPETSHLVDMKWDASLVKFPGWENTCGLMAIAPHHGPGPVHFDANLAALEKSDFPVSDVGWPLMSRRMLEVLTSVRPFPHRVIPVVMLDDTLPAGDRFDVEGHQHRFDSGVLEFFDDLSFAFPSPSTIPRLGQRFDVGTLRLDPGFGVGITMQIDDSHECQVFI